MSVPWLIITLGNGVFVPPIVTPREAPPDNSGAGHVVNAPHKGPYGRAFPRSVRELYRKLPQEAFEPPQPTDKQDSGKKDESKLSPEHDDALPIIMDFGKGEVALGMYAPSFGETIQNQILADDEEAIIAIIRAIS